MGCSSDRAKFPAARSVSRRTQTPARASKPNARRINLTSGLVDDFLLRSWQSYSDRAVLTFIVILLILVALAAVASIAYGIWVQRTLKGKGKSGRGRLRL